MAAIITLNLERATHFTPTPTYTLRNDKNKNLQNAQLKKYWLGLDQRETIAGPEVTGWATHQFRAQASDYLREKCRPPATATLALPEGWFPERLKEYFTVTNVFPSLPRLPSLSTHPTFLPFPFDDSEMKIKRCERKERIHTMGSTGRGRGRGRGKSRTAFNNL